MTVFSCFLRQIFAIGLFITYSLSCRAYSVLTHEAIIDANWDRVLLPLLKQRFPASSSEELKEAHAYAYGGSVAPDMGYYPFGSKLFTNLIHYVRSGEFIEILFSDAGNINEYAFAAGVLCHYYADIYGHRVGINLSVPVIYPKMKKKFGNVVTFGQNRISHIRTEFAFDVLQTARGNYASTAYHDFIGFKIAEGLLERAFRETYGLDVNELFGNFSRATDRFRWTVINLFPIITKAAWVNKKAEIKELRPNVTGRNFIYRMHRKNYHHLFAEKDEPKFFAHVASLVLQIFPKVGPLRALNFDAPGPYAEKLFIVSFDSASANYASHLSQRKQKTIDLSNIDFDTGVETRPGEYPLADETYRKLLMCLKEKRFETVSLALKQNILSFYSNQTDSGPKINGQQKAVEAIAELKTVQPAGKK